MKIILAQPKFEKKQKKENKYFSSMEECCQYFKISRHVLIRLIKDGLEYMGYFFDELFTNGYDKV